MSAPSVPTWKAGAAKAAITPTETMWMAGWAVRREPSRGTISDLFCRALTIEDANGTKVIIVTLDLIAAPRWLVDPVAEEIQRTFGISREQIIFCASHTHCGPEIRPDKAYFFQIPTEWMEKVPAYNEQLQRTMTRVIGESLERLVPARLFFSKTKATFGQNRRTGSGAHDEDVPVLDICDTNGKHLATVFGYACHNLTLDPQDRRFCADWSGFAAEQLERNHPGCTALFLTGAGADQDPFPRGTLELAQQHGKNLADAIEQSLGTLEAIPGSIRTAWVEVPLIFQPVSRGQLEADAASDDPPRKRKAEWLLNEVNCGRNLPKEHPYPIQGVQIGEFVQIIAMSCEPVVDWSLRLKSPKDVMPFPWVAGYCNDLFGYIPTRRIQSEGGYEAGRATLWSWMPAPFTDDVEDRVMDGIRRLIATLQSKETQ